MLLAVFTFNVPLLKDIASIFLAPSSPNIFLTAALNSSQTKADSTCLLMPIFLSLFSNNFLSIFSIYSSGNNINFFLLSFQT
ncbi:hypothetical protein CO123_02955 [bacterium (Candidatus Howlettbacteria) CG_4_9_14_3_um_filter_37_10]|nr:MAG: hypothetical protein CO123_02955 [bacterium (Candidatus Howlettbacteria) CG_4_9_14_3_um_filter_37_10]